MDASRIIKLMIEGARLINHGRRWELVERGSSHRISTVTCSEMLKLESSGAVKVEMHGSWAEGYLQ